MKPAKQRNTDRQWFSSSNHWGIPDLLPERLASIVPGPMHPFLVYRTAKLTRANSQRGILGFFVEDYRFSCAWSYPKRMAAVLAGLELSAVCEPDYSVYADAPLVEQLQMVYQMRWCGRFWQSIGLPVIPTLTWSDKRSFEFCFSGIPYGCPVVAVESRACGRFRREFNFGLAAALEIVSPSRLLIYGDRNAWIQLPAKQEVQWISPATNRRFQELKDVKARRN